MSTLFRDERGIVGLALLGIALLLALGGAGMYVYQVRTGQAEPISQTILAPKSAPAAIKADAKNLSDMDVTDDQL